MQPESAGRRNPVIGISREPHLYGSLLRRSLPDGQRLTVRVLRLARRVVAPPNRHVECTGVLGYEETQTYRRREETLLRRPPFVGGLLDQPSGVRDLVEGVVLVNVTPVLERRVRRDQEPGQVPVRRSPPTGQ